jgi:hypothetical protein
MIHILTQRASLHQTRGVHLDLGCRPSSPQHPSHRPGIKPRAREHSPSQLRTRGHPAPQHSSHPHPTPSHPNPRTPATPTTERQTIRPHDSQPQTRHLVVAAGSLSGLDGPASRWTHRGKAQVQPRYEDLCAARPAKNLDPPIPTKHFRPRPLNQPVANPAAANLGTRSSASHGPRATPLATFSRRPTCTTPSGVRRAPSFCACLPPAPGVNGPTGYRQFLGRDGVRGGGCPQVGGLSTVSPRRAVSVGGCR